MTLGANAGRSVVVAAHVPRSRDASRRDVVVLAASRADQTVADLVGHFVARSPLSDIFG